jgi:glutathionylspermidine synthase
MNWYKKAFKGVGGKVVYGDITSLKINQCHANCTKASWTLDGKNVDCVLSLYPKEWLATEISKDDLLSIDLSQLRTIEPWWKLIVANKAMLPLLWKMYPNNKHLLPTFYDYDDAKSQLGFKNVVSKPLYGREGTGIKFGW